MGSFLETYNDPNVVQGKGVSCKQPQNGKPAKAKGRTLVWYIKKREMNCFTFPVKGSERDFGLHVIQTTGPFLCLNIKPGYKIQNSPYFDCSIVCIFPRRPRLVSLTSHYGRTGLLES